MEKWSSRRAAKPVFFHNTLPATAHKLKQPKLFSLHWASPDLTEREVKSAHKLLEGTLIKYL